MTQPITGVQRFARELIGELGRHGPDTLKFIIAIPEDTVIHPIENIETYIDNSQLPTSLWQQVRLPILMEKLKADLLWSPCNIGPLFARDQVITIHDSATFAGPEWFSLPFRTYYRVIFPMLGKRALRVITPSIFSKKELIRFGIAPEEKISVISEGISSMFISCQARNQGYPYIFALGSGNPRKNIPALIEAWGRIEPGIKGERKLLIAGRGAKSFSSENLHTIPDDVWFTGYKTDEDLQSLYSGADVFIFPSLYEGFGLPPLEAMACGCPVIVSNTASMPEVCGEAAYYIDPLSIESISEGIKKVLTDRGLRKNLVQKGNEQVKLFTWKKSASKHISYFEELRSRD